MWSPSLETPHKKVNGDVFDYLRSQDLNLFKRDLTKETLSELPSTPILKRTAPNSSPILCSTQKLIEFQDVDASPILGSKISGASVAESEDLHADEEYSGLLPTQALLDIPLSGYGRTNLPDLLPTEFKTGNNRSCYISGTARELGNALADEAIDYQSASALRPNDSLPGTQQYRPALLGDLASLRINSNILQETKIQNDNIVGSGRKLVAKRPNAWDIHNEKANSNSSSTNDSEDNEYPEVEHIKSPLDENAEKLDCLTGFTTAAGKKLPPPSKEAIEKFKKLASREDKKDFLKITKPTTENNTGFGEIEKGDENQIMKFGGFQTGAGKKLAEPSAAAKARFFALEKKIVSKMEYQKTNESKVDEARTDDVTPWSESSKEYLPNPNRAASSKDQISLFGGFSTGAGRKLEPPSKEARKKFAEIERNQNVKSKFEADVPQIHSGDNLNINRNIKISQDFLVPEVASKNSSLQKEKYHKHVKFADEIVSLPERPNNIIENNEKESLDTPLKYQNVEEPQINILKRHSEPAKNNFQKFPRLGEFRSESRIFLSSNSVLDTPVNNRISRPSVRRKRIAGSNIETPNLQAYGTPSSKPVLGGQLTTPSSRGVPFKIPTITSQQNSKISHKSKSISSKSSRFSGFQTKVDTRKKLAELPERMENSANQQYPWDLVIPDNARDVLLNDTNGNSKNINDYREFLVSNSCDSQFITEDWLINHYTLIVWKAAKMMATFDGLDIWKFEYVAEQLRYRYHVEFNCGKRSFFKLLSEGDEAAGCHIVVCVTKVNKEEPVSVTVTDGWYFFPLEIDLPMLELIESRRIFVGQKLHIQSAQLVGGSGPCPILEKPISMKLKVAANSVRIARRFETLGKSRQKSFSVNLKSIKEHGGIVECVEITIKRKYPIIYFEKLENGECITRSALEEEEAVQHWQNRYEDAFNEKLAQFDNNQEGSNVFSKNPESIRKEIENIVQEIIPTRNVSSCITLQVCDNPPLTCHPYSCGTAIISLWGYSEEDLEELEEGKSYKFHSLKPSGYKGNVMKLKSTRNTKFVPTEIYTPQKYLNERYLIPLNEIPTKTEDTIDIACLIVAIQINESKDHYSYRLLCTDESLRFAIIEIVSYMKRDSVLKPWNPVIFLNLQHVYSCKRYHRLSASKFTLISKTPIAPYQKSRRLRELSAWAGKQIDLKERTEDFESILTEVGLGCPEQIIDAKVGPENVYCGKILEFQSFFSTGSLYYFGRAGYIAEIANETGIIFEFDTGNENFPISFSEDLFLSILEHFLPESDIEDLFERLSHRNSQNANLIEKRLIVMENIEFESSAQKVLFLIQNGRIHSTNQYILLPFTEAEWKFFIGWLSDALSREEIQINLQDGPRNCKYVK